MSSSGPRAIAKMDHSIIEAALVQEFRHHPHVGGQTRLAAADDDRRGGQMIVVGDPGPDGVRGENGTTHAVEPGGRDGGRQSHRFSARMGSGLL